MTPTGAEEVENLRDALARDELHLALYLECDCQLNCRQSVQLR